MIDFVSILERPEERKLFNDMIWRELRDHFVRQYQHELGNAFTYELKERLKENMPKIADQLIQDRHVDLRGMVRKVIEQRIDQSIDAIIDEEVDKITGNIPLSISINRDSF